MNHRVAHRDDEESTAAGFDIPPLRSYLREERSEVVASVQDQSHRTSLGA